MPVKCMGKKISIYKKKGDIFVKTREIEEKKAEKDPFLTEPDADIPSDVYIEEEEEE